VATGAGCKRETTDLSENLLTFQPIFEASICTLNEIKDLDRCR